MEKLKELLIIALIWAVIIWFARVMKRKSNEQSKKFQENILEMELIDEEERSYICENIVSFTTGRNVFLWFIILLNLWLTSVYGWKSINMAIHGTADAFSSNLCPTSVFGGIAYSTNLLRTAWLKERERNETGVLKKRIVEVKAYEHPGANNWNGIIKGRKPGISVNISIPNGAYIMQEDNNMAMLIENEGGDFYLIPRIEAERESSKQEQ